MAITISLGQDALHRTLLSGLYAQVCATDVDALIKSHVEPLFNESVVFADVQPKVRESTDVTVDAYARQLHLGAAADVVVAADGGPPGPDPAHSAFVLKVSMVGVPKTHRTSDKNELDFLSLDFDPKSSVIKVFEIPLQEGGISTPHLQVPLIPRGLLAVLLRPTADADGPSIVQDGTWVTVRVSDHLLLDGVDVGLPTKAPAPLSAADDVVLHLSKRSVEFLFESLLHGLAEPVQTYLRVSGKPKAIVGWEHVPAATWTPQQAGTAMGGPWSLAAQGKLQFEEVGGILKDPRLNITLGVDSFEIRSSELRARVKMRLEFELDVITDIGTSLLDVLPIKSILGILGASFPLGSVIQVTVHSVQSPNDDVIDMQLGLRIALQGVAQFTKLVSDGSGIWLGGALTSLPLPQLGAFQDQPLLQAIGGPHDRPAGTPSEMLKAFTEGGGRFRVSVGGQVAFAGTPSLAFVYADHDLRRGYFKSGDGLLEPAGVRRHCN